MKPKKLVIALFTISLFILTACSNTDEDLETFKVFIEERDIAGMATEIKRMENEENDKEIITDEIIEISDSFLDLLIEEKDFKFLLDNQDNLKIISSISNDDNRKTDRFLEEEKKKLRTEVEQASKDKDHKKVEAMFNDNVLLQEGTDLKVVNSYIEFLKSDEPMSLKAGKLMGSVDYGYSGILSSDIKNAVYSPHEEGSFTRDTSQTQEGYDYIDWKSDYSKDAYATAKRHKELALTIEVEEILNKKLIEDAKGQNPHIGMTKAEVEASLWGLPEKVNRTVSTYGTREQWVYGNRQYLYFKDGILTSFQD